MMQTVNEIPKAFYKISTQIIHILSIPVFFVVFVLLYKPANIISFINARELLEFNLIMMSCIILVSMIITRFTRFFLRQRLLLNYTLYISCCVIEIVIYSMFCALYLHLMQGKVDSYFNVAAKCITAIGSISLWPYLLLAYIISLNSLKKEAKEEAPLPEDDRIRFKDVSQKLKLIVSAESILYIEAKENYVDIVYTDSEEMKRYTLRASMKNLENMLQSQGLQRCHRSYFINPKHVKILRKDPRGYVFADLDNASCPSIPVSKSYYDQLSSLL